MNKLYRTVLIVSLAISAFSCSDDSPSGPDTKGGTSIGVTLPLTGDSPLDIAAHSYLIELAVNDVNDYFSANDIDMKVTADIRDTENEPQGLINAFNHFTENNIRYVASAGISMNLFLTERSLGEFNGIMIHSSSTALIEKPDNLFRIIPNDVTTTDEITKMLVSDGVKKLIILYRNDIWGYELSETLVEYAYEKDIEVHTVEYEAMFLPYGLDDALAECEAKYEELSEGSAPGDVAMAVMAFNEMSEIMTIASESEALLGMRWYGGDGYILNETLITDPNLAAVASRVKLSCPAVAENPDSAYQKLKAKVTEKLSYTPRSNNFLIYDAVRAAALAMAKNLDNPVDAATQAFAEEGYIFGDIELDEDGDRQGLSYQHLNVVNNGGEYSWAERD